MKFINEETSLLELQDICDMLDLCCDRISKIEINGITNWNKESACHKIQDKCNKLVKLADMI